MIVGLGIDVVAVERVRRLFGRHGQRFLDRCFCPGEVTRPADAEHLAGLLAAKEAAFKALGTGWDSGVGWRTIAVRRTAAGAPGLELSGVAATRCEALGAARSHLTITHDAGVAVAVVILEG